MNLVVFDIDGTLTDTNRVDGDIFQKTFADLYKIKDLSTDWGAYAHSTDSGILDEIFRTKLGHPPDPFDIEKFINYFVDGLHASHSDNPDLFGEIPGASRILDELPNRGWKTAIATGAWRRSALFKLEHGGLHYSKVPAAHAEDSFERSQIILKAVERAMQKDGVKSYDRIVYVGDGGWDRKAAARLKIPFIHRAENLDPASMPHYRNAEKFYELLERAEVPSALS